MPEQPGTPINATQSPAPTSSPASDAPDSPKTPSTTLSVPAKAAQPSPAAPDKAVKSREQKLQEACEKAFSSVKSLTGSMFSHEGICKKCGWHTMQHSEEAANELLAAHVSRHWRDVAASVDAPETPEAKA